MSSIPNNAYLAARAFGQAVEDAGNFIDAQMMQFGWQMPDATGNYSTQAAGDAFDPNRVLTIDPTTGRPLSSAPTMTQGQYGPKGAFAESARESAGEEAQLLMQSRQRGFGAGSGLGRQASELSETLAKRRMGDLSAQLFGGLSGQYSTILSALGRTSEGRAIDANTLAQMLAGRIPTGGG